MLTLSVIFCARLSNLILSEFIFKMSYHNLIRLHFRMEYKFPIQFDLFIGLALHSLFIQLPFLFLSKLRNIL